MKTAVEGILEQFRKLGGALAVALCDGDGRVVAASGDGDATAALGTAIAKLLRGLPVEDDLRPVEALFEDAPEYTILRDGPSSVSLHLRRVGEDWTLAAVWNDDGAVDAGDGFFLARPDRVRRYAAETAARLQNVC